MIHWKLHFLSENRFLSNQILSAARVPIDVAYTTPPTASRSYELDSKDSRGRRRRRPAACSRTKSDYTARVIAQLLPRLAFGYRGHLRAVLNPEKLAVSSSKEESIDRSSIVVSRAIQLRFVISILYWLLGSNLKAKRYTMPKFISQIDRKR